MENKIQNPFDKVHKSTLETADFKELKRRINNQSEIVIENLYKSCNSNMKYFSEFSDNEYAIDLCIYCNGYIDAIESIGKYNY